MKGTMLSISVGGGIKRTEFKMPISLDDLKAGIGGGYLEAIPYFDTYMDKGELVFCRAFCDEEGKIKEFDVNSTASIAWADALGRAGRPRLNDYLVGSIAIVFGDREFMAEL
jgi:hypothetical protein